MPPRRGWQRCVVLFVVASLLALVVLFNGSVDFTGGSATDADGTTAALTDRSAPPVLAGTWIPEAATREEATDRAVLHPSVVFSATTVQRTISTATQMTSTTTTEATTTTSTTRPTRPPRQSRSTRPPRQRFSPPRDWPSHFPLVFNGSVPAWCEEQVYGFARSVGEFSYHWALPALLDDSYRVAHFTVDPRVVATVLKKGVTSYTVVAVTEAPTTPTPFAYVAVDPVNRSFAATVGAYASCWESAVDGHRRPPLDIAYHSSVRGMVTAAADRNKPDAAAPRTRIDLVTHGSEGRPMMSFEEQRSLPDMLATAAGGGEARAVGVLVIEKFSVWNWTAPTLVAVAAKVERRIIITGTARATCHADDAADSAWPHRDVPVLVQFMRDAGHEWEEEFGFSAMGGMVVLRRRSVTMWPVDGGYMASRGEWQADRGDLAPWRRSEWLSSIIGAAPFQGDPNAAARGALPTEAYDLNRESVEAVRLHVRAHHADANNAVDAGFTMATGTAFAAPMALASFFHEMSKSVSIFGCTPTMVLRWMRTAWHFYYNRGGQRFYVASEAAKDKCALPGTLGYSDDRFEWAALGPTPLDVGVGPAETAIMLASYLHAHPGVTVAFANAPTVVVIGTTAQPLSEDQLEVDDFTVVSVVYGGVGLMVLRRRDADEAAAFDAYVFRRRLLHRALPAWANTTMGAQDWARYRAAVADVRAPRSSTEGWVARANAQEPCAYHFRGKTIHLSAAAANESSVATLRPVRIVCAVYSIAMRAARVVAQFETWGRHCDRFAVFVGFTVPWFDPVRSRPNGRVEVVNVDGGDMYLNAWRKSIAVRDRLMSWSDITEFDYILYCGDDAFVLVNNLRRFLNTDVAMQNARQEGRPMIAGLRCISPHSVRFTQGGAYVFNAAALRLLVAHRSCRSDASTSQEDQLIHHCMAEAARPNWTHVPYMAADEFGEPLFNMYNPQRAENSVVDPGSEREFDENWDAAWNLKERPQGVEWHKRPDEVGYHRAPLGLNMHSYRGVSYHYVESDEMRALGALYYPDPGNDTAA